MRDWDPKSLWEELRRAVQGWIDEDAERPVDPSLAFHLLFAAPLVMGILVMIRRA